MESKEIWFATLAALVILVCLGASLIVWRVAPTRRLNKRLAVVLLAEGLVFVAGLVMQVPARLDPLDDVAYFAFVISIIAIPWLYLRFLAWGLETPWTAPLRRRWVDRSLLIVPASCIAGAFLVAAASGFADTPNVPWPMFPMAAALFLVPVYAIVASVAALRRAPPGSALRDRARAFLAAFALRDVSFLLAMLGFAGMTMLFGNWEYAAARDIPYTPPPSWALALHQASFWFLAAGLLIYVPLLAYGVLKTQLFDIEVKIKAGVKASVLTVFFLVAFFVAEQIGQTLISDRAGTFVGLAGAGLLAVAIEPLRRVADRVARSAVPGAVDTPESVAARKVQVYRAALEGAYEDGDITPKERAMLYRLAGELGLEPVDVLRVEDEVRTSAQAPAPAPTMGSAAP